MKILHIKVIAGCMFFVFIAMSSFGQATTKMTKKEGKKAVKVEKSNVPKEVTESFYLDYPGITNYDWYAYPVYDNPSNWYKDYWYDDWFDYGPYSYTESPAYYEVEFTKDKIQYNIVYTKAGKKVATHRILTSKLPLDISSAIRGGEYKDWKLGKYTEEIFRDKDTDKLKVFKVVVTKGKEKHTLFFEANGKLLKDKKVA